MYIDKKKCIDIKNRRLFPFFKKKSPRLGNGTNDKGARNGIE